MKFKNAFTLSEVLIVIAIIGIVATLTITNLSNDYEEDEIVTRVKIAYNDIELAYQKAINQYGPYETWNSSLSTDERAKRILDFIKGSYLDSNDCLQGTGAMVCIYGVKKEIENGTIIAVSTRANSNSSFRFFVYPLGNSSTYTPGTDAFEFNTTDNNQTIIPRGFGTDRNDVDDLDLWGSSIDQSDDYLYNATNWVVHVGNLEYKKCDDLNWETKTTCD